MEGLPGRRCLSSHADRLLVFKSFPGDSQSFDEPLMKEHIWQLISLELLFVVLATILWKTLIVTWPPSGWAESWVGGKEGIVTSLFTSYGPNTNHAPTLSSMNTLPSGSSQSIGEAGCERKRAVTVMCTVECTVWGALGDKGGKGYRLKGSQKASGKKSPWWWPRQKKNVLGRRIDIFKDIEVKITLVRCCIVENSHLLLMCPQKATLENQLEIV